MAQVAKMADVSAVAVVHKSVGILESETAPTSAIKDLASSS